MSDNNKKNKTTMKTFTTEEIRDLFNQVMHEEISFSRMVEVINERVSEASKPKFKKGDKVRIKNGVSSKTHRLISPGFTTSMDELIEKELTVDGYAVGEVYIEESGYKFNEDWLEHYVEELKEGDLAIFWDNNKKCAIIRFYKKLNESDVSFRNKDQSGLDWKNAIKFESKEQYERLIKGGDMNSSFMYCQSEIEGCERCETQCDHCKSYYAPLEDHYRYFLPHDIARCNRDDCPLHLECARWLDRLPMEDYWYSQFEPKGCENFIEKNVESKKKKK